jgi:hypothetical protein
VSAGSRHGIDELRSVGRVGSVDDAGQVITLPLASPACFARWIRRLIMIMVFLSITPDRPPLRLLTHCLRSVHASNAQ